MMNLSCLSRSAFVFQYSGEHFRVNFTTCFWALLLIVQPSFGQAMLTFVTEFHTYTCMHAFGRLIVSHHTVKVHDVTAKHCSPIDQRQAPEKNSLFYSRTGPEVSTDCPKVFSLPVFFVVVVVFLFSFQQQTLPTVTLFSCLYLRVLVCSWNFSLL